MKELQIIFVLACILGSLSSLAQTNRGRIVGTVTTANQKALESATTTLLRAKDSSVVKTGAS
ncbi:MAG TPA: hypothetical protein VK666_26530, partial [Chryseolinea sp.]|nr:hypothetical protein [Chryseolinea sp.]